MKRARPLALAFAAAFAAATLGFERAAPAAAPDPATEARRLLQQLDRPETRGIVEAPVSKAKAALQRAQNARGAGDLLHATELDALALTWAQVASDLVRAAASEKKLAELQKSVVDLEQKAVRTQALIEQTIARRGRAEQNLSALTSASSPKAMPTERANPKSSLKAKPSAPPVRP